jgi:hypothetical protein
MTPVRIVEEQPGTGWRPIREEQLQPPLCDCLTLRDDAEGGCVFPGARAGRPLSNSVFLMLLRRMQRDDLTTHGFRSTFRDWAAETGHPADLAEAALAHVQGGKVQAAYQRGDMLERRRSLMEDWATFCAGDARPGRGLSHSTRSTHKKRGSRPVVTARSSDGYARSDQSSLSDSRTPTANAWRAN